MKGDEIVRPFHRHSNGTATVRIHVNKDKHIRKWMLVFLVKFENRGMKIARVNSSHITKNINLLSFRMALGVRCDVNILNKPPVRSSLIVNVTIWNNFISTRHDTGYIYKLHWNIINKSTNLLHAVTLEYNVGPVEYNKQINRSNMKCGPIISS